MFSRVAIVNRGEAAMRLIHAVRELAARTSATVEVIALHTDVDRTATFVREADVAYDLGGAAARPYLNLKILESALTATGADAAWVGWGFVAEDPSFAELCERLGVTFIGPGPEAMRRLGDKIGAKLLTEEAGVPVASHDGLGDRGIVRLGARRRPRCRRGPLRRGGQPHRRRPSDRCPPVAGRRGDRRRTRRRTSADDCYLHTFSVPDPARL